MRVAKEAATKQTILLLRGAQRRSNPDLTSLMRKEIASLRSQ
jgi:hypothetical protein